MQTKLLAISEIFAGLDCDVWHYQAPDQAEAPYVIWAEDDRLDLEAGNVHVEKAWQGTIDLFTHDEFDTLADDIEALLDSKDFAWRLESVQYEDEESLIHTEWVWNYA